MENGLKLIDHLRRECAEIGQATEPMSEDERIAAARAAEALAEELAAAGIDARDLVQTLARRWSELRAGVLGDDSGRQIYLPNEVSFLHFYRFRSEILKWLAANARGINNG
jgi:hypothetical protein